VTGYRLDGPGIDSHWGGKIFCTRPDWPLMPTHSLIQWVPGLSRGYSGQGMALTTHPHLVLRLKKEYSYTSTPPLGLHGLLQGELYLVSQHSAMREGTASH